MSAVNPTHIIADGMREIATSGQNDVPGAREDGQLWGAFPNTMTLTDLAEHVVSKLTDAGYSIVETERYERLQRGANELGRRLGRQLQDVLTLTGAHNLIDEDGDGDWMGVWERLGELVEKGQQYEAARRIEAATTTEEVRAVIAEFLPAAAAEGEKP